MTSLATRRPVLGAPHIPGLPASSVVESSLVLRNALGTSTSVSPKLSFRSGGADQIVRLPNRNLAGSGVGGGDLRTTPAGAGFTGPVNRLGVSLTFSGTPGDVASAGHFDVAADDGRREGSRNAHREIGFNAGISWANVMTQARKDLFESIYVDDGVGVFIHINNHFHLVFEGDGR